MASGFGADPTLDVDGKVLSGTTAQDIRRIIGALYSPGLISGGEIVTSGSAMTYTVSGGVAIIRLATGQHVAAPFDQTTLTVSTANSARTDIIFALQNLPENGNSNVVVGVNQVLPPNAVEIGRFAVGVGITNTNNAVRQGGIDFAIPYGANLGILHKFNHAYKGALPTARTVLGTGKIHLPTDRNIRFRYTGVHCAENAIMWDTSKYCELGVLPMLDGLEFEQWNTSGLHSAWETVHFETIVPVSAGTHTVGLMRYRKQGPGTPYQLQGYYPDGFYRRGADFTVEDVGPVI